MAVKHVHRRRMWNEGGGGYASPRRSVSGMAGWDPPGWDRGRWDDYHRQRLERRVRRMSEPRRAQCRSCGAWITFGTKDGKFIPLERVELFTLKEYQDPREERPRYEMIPKGPETLYMSHGDRCPARRQGPPADRQPQQPQQRRLPATGRRDDDVPF